MKYPQTSDSRLNDIVELVSKQCIGHEHLNKLIKAYNNKPKRDNLIVSAECVSYLPIGGGGFKNFVNSIQTKSKGILGLIF